MKYYSSKITTESFFNDKKELNRKEFISIVWKLFRLLNFKCIHKIFQCIYIFDTDNNLYFLNWESESPPMLYFYIQTKNNTSDLNNLKSINAIQAHLKVFRMWISNRVIWITSPNGITTFFDKKKRDSVIIGRVLINK